MQKEELIIKLLPKPNILCKESIFKNTFQEHYLGLLKINFPNNFKFSQKLFHYINDDYNLNLGMCEYCNSHRCKFISLFVGYRKYCCNKCAQSSPEIQQKIRNTLKTHYGVEIPLQSKEIKEKAKKTCLERYDCENAFQNKDIQEKAKKTCLNRYGCENAFQNEEIKEKIKQTNIEKYGCENPSQSKEIKEKAKKTCLERYGVEHSSQSKEWKEHISKISYIKYGVKSFLQTDDFKNKSSKTCLEKYGARNYTQTNEYLKKSYNTKKKNNSFHTSKIEEELYNWFVSQNISVKHQYKSDTYPFACDFYLPAYNLYIEIQGSWTHGGHPFNENDRLDINKLNIWKEKSKNSKYYKNAINVWTIKDVLKRTTAKNNNLNYLEIFSSDLSQITHIIHKYIYN